jgi:hypothetical protein
VRKKQATDAKERQLEEWDRLKDLWLDGKELDQNGTRTADPFKTVFVGRLVR